MFRYFGNNYPWNLAVDLAIEMGARIGEIEEMCAPLREVAQRGSDEGTRQFATSWRAMADKLCELADEDRARGRLLSAGDQLALENCERVEIPYGDERLAGLYVRAEGNQGRAPLLVQINGLDSTKEMKYRVGLPHWLARRGVSSLLVDQPARGCVRAALCLRGRRGANHDWREGAMPVPHYWQHVCWVWGARDVDDFMGGVLDRIRVPFLVTHGEQDKQIPVAYAHRTYEQLINSPARELKIFTTREGGSQHSSFDNSANAGAYIADWVAEKLGGRTA